MPRRLLRHALPLAALALTVPSASDAHRVGISRGDYRLAGDEVRVELSFSRAELAGAVPALDPDRDAHVSAAELDGARSALARAVTSGVDALRAGVACPGTLERAALSEGDGVTLSASLHCPRGSGPVSIDLRFLAALSFGHRHLVTAGAGNDEAHSVAYAGNSAFELRPPGETVAANGTAAPLFRLGIQHILTGYDHLVFLAGLILVGGRLRPLLLAVTAFTLAHSITLGLSALGIYAPSPTLVEPGIALSIAYVGVENFFVKDARRRWCITFPFGLVHGFGFAGALREIALPRAQVPLALVSFNLGVETGQIAVLVVLLPVLVWLRRRTWFESGGWALANAAIALAGLGWFIARVS